MKFLSWDLETHKIQPGLLAPPIVCGAFAWRMTSGEVDSSLHSPDSQKETIHSVLQGHDTVCGANIAYDFGCLVASNPSLLPLVWKAYEDGRVFDVLISATLDAIYAGRLTDGELFERSGKKISSGRYSLQSVTADYLGRSDAKKNDRWRLSYALLENTPIEQWPDDAKQYPIDDVTNTLLVAEKLLAEARNLQDLYRQCHAAFCMHLGSIWGMRVDTARALALKSDIDEQLEGIHEFAKQHNLLRLGGTKKAPKWTKDTKLIKELVFKAYEGLPPSTESGETSLSRETLESSGDEVLKKFSEISKWEKLRTYADTLVSFGVKPMNVEVNPILSTGRASYKGLIQLMPKKGGVRECFIAREGYAFCSVDYAAVELSTFAQVQLWTIGVSKLADVINSGKDPHSAFAAEMTNDDYERFVKNKKLLRESLLRFAAKAGNFGFPGMMGAAKFVIAQKMAGHSVCKWTKPNAQCGAVKIRVFKGKELDSPLCTQCVLDGEKLRKAYIAQWNPRPYWKWVTSQMGEGGRIEQFVSKRVRGGLSAPAAANTLFQGLASDMAKKALIDLTQEAYLDRSSPLYGSRLCAFAHDETIMEHRLDRLHEASARQVEVMVAARHIYCPDVLVSAEPAAMTRWYKNADPVYDANKRLIPWEPKE